MSGGKSVAAGQLAPRSRRGIVGQVDTVRKGSAPPVVATGGTVTDITVGGVAYKLHTFTAGGSFTVTAGGDVDYYMVGGGYGPGADSTGGGAGGTNTGTVAVSATTYTVTVGGGGSVNGNNGGTSYVNFSGTPTANASNTFASGNGFAAGSGYSSTFSNSLAGGGGGARSWR